MGTALGELRGTATQERRNESSLLNADTIIKYSANRIDSVFKLWVPFQTETGTYRMRGDTVAVESGRLSGRYLSSVTNAELRLQPIGGGSKPPMIFAKASQ